MAVSEDAIQTLDGKEVIFVAGRRCLRGPRGGDLGRRDGEWAEVLSGGKPGDVYCSANSFVLKAELGKGEAKHEH